MKKTTFLTVTALCVLLLSACGSLQPVTSVIPEAVNTIHATSFDELNLDRNDYTILNTISAEATVYYKESRSEIEIEEANQEFEIKHSLNAGQVLKSSYSGIMRIGYLANDYRNQKPVQLTSPSDIARGFATYRLINMAQQEGADGIVEPTISTNIEQQGKTIVYRTIISAKIIKLKADR